MIDDNAAKKTAKYLGLKVTGTIEVLFESQERGLFRRLLPFSKKMKRTDFISSESLEQLVLEQVGEQHNIYSAMKLTKTIWW